MPARGPLVGGAGRRAVVWVALVWLGAADDVAAVEVFGLADDGAVAGCDEAGAASGLPQAASTAITKSIAHQRVRTARMTSSPNSAYCRSGASGAAKARYPGHRPTCAGLSTGPDRQVAGILGP